MYTVHGKRYGTSLWPLDNNRKSLSASLYFVHGHQTVRSDKYRSGTTPFLRTTHIRSHDYSHILQLYVSKTTRTKNPFTMWQKLNAAVLFIVNKLYNPSSKGAAAHSTTRLPPSLSREVFQSWPPHNKELKIHKINTIKTMIKMSHSNRRYVWKEHG